MPAVASSSTTVSIQTRLLRDATASTNFAVQSTVGTEADAHPDYFRRTKAFSNKEIPMKNRARFTSMALAGLIAGVLSIPLPLPLHAQESTAGKEMHESGVSAKAAAGAAADSVKHAYHATKDQLGDATLTTKVKTALMSDDLTRKYTIHVESEHGKVTLDGIVDSPAMAQRAQTLAANIHGVETVRNHLTWPMSAR